MTSLAKKVLGALVLAAAGFAQARRHHHRAGGAALGRAGHHRKADGAGRQALFRPHQQQGRRQRPEDQGAGGRRRVQGRRDRAPDQGDAGQARGGGAVRLCRHRQYRQAPDRQGAGGGRRRAGGALHGGRATALAVQPLDFSRARRLCRRGGAHGAAAHDAGHEAHRGHVPGRRLRQGGPGGRRSGGGQARHEARHRGRLRAKHRQGGRCGEEDQGRGPAGRSS